MNENEETQLKSIKKRLAGKISKVELITEYKAKKDEIKKLFEEILNELSEEGLINMTVYSEAKLAVNQEKFLAEIRTRHNKIQL